MTSKDDDTGEASQSEGTGGKPISTGADENWQRWSMFTLDTIGTADVPADTDLLLPPSVPKVAEGPALEEVLVRPRTTLLRQGFDAGKQYFVNEEEVPQAGTRLSVAYNRTRWRDGRVAVWLGAQRGAGRGEGSSALGFDLVVDTPLPPS